jgi:DNA polymerase
MTADEKASLARFFDLAAAAATSGYLGEGREYHFQDDPEQDETCPAPQVSVAAAGEAAIDSLEQIAADTLSCAACKLCETRANAVPGEGAQRPLVMVIGEGPGADEDASGRPFVGKAGQLLDKMLASIGLSRETNCFIANVIKCRPPGNRDPLPEEIAACAPFIHRQIKILQPRFILSAGRIATQALLKTAESMGQLRGRIIELQTDSGAIQLIATYHPSALLRNEDLKRPAWEDLKLLRSALEG